METKLFMGCDIAQDTFAFCLRDQSKVVCQGEVSNSKAIQAWLKNLSRFIMWIYPVSFFAGAYRDLWDDLMRTLYTDH